MQATLVDVIVIVEHKDRIDVALIIVYLLITHLVRTHSSYKLKVSCGPFAVCYTILSRTCRLRFRQLTKRNPTPFATSWLFVLILVSSLFCSLETEEGDTMEWHRLFACLPTKALTHFCVDVRATCRIRWVVLEAKILGTCALKICLYNQQQHIHFSVFANFNWPF